MSTATMVTREVGYVRKIMTRNPQARIVASVMVIGVVSAAFQFLATVLVNDRENGILKRLRSAQPGAHRDLPGRLPDQLDPDSRAAGRAGSRTRAGCLLGIPARRTHSRRHSDGAGRGLRLLRTGTRPHRHDPQAQHRHRARPPPSR
jgi:hypothetical protein